MHTRDQTPPLPVLTAAVSLPIQALDAVEPADVGLGSTRPERVPNSSFIRNVSERPGPHSNKRHCFGAYSLRSMSRSLAGLLDASSSGAGARRREEQQEPGWRLPAHRSSP